MLIRLVTMIVVAAAAIQSAGCLEAEKATLRTAVVEMGQGAATKMLADTKFADVLANVKGAVGPDTLIEVEGYTKTSAGGKLYIHGASMSVGVEGRGRDLNPDSAQAMAQLREIIQRYQLEADKVTDAAIARRNAEIAALLDLIRRAPTSQPSEQ